MPGLRRRGAVPRPTRPGELRTRTPSIADARLPALALAALVALAAACSPTGDVTAEPTPTASALPSAGGEPGPSPTPWPANTIEVMIAFGTADAEIQEAIGDLQAALDNEDIALMHDAADQFASILDRMLERTHALTDYPGTAELGGNLAAAYTLLRDGASQIRDATASGDAAGVAAGYRELTEGLELYAHQRQALSDAAEQAVFMDRLLVR